MESRIVSDVLDEVHRIDEPYLHCDSLLVLSYHHVAAIAVYNHSLHVDNNSDADPRRDQESVRSVCLLVWTTMIDPGKSVQFAHYDAMMNVGVEADDAEQRCHETPTILYRPDHVA